MTNLVMILAEDVVTFSVSRCRWLSSGLEWLAVYIEPLNGVCNEAQRERP